MPRAMATAERTALIGGIEVGWRWTGGTVACKAGAADTFHAGSSRCGLAGEKVVPVSHAAPATITGAYVVAHGGLSASPPPHR